MVARMIKSRVPKSSNVDGKPCSERWGSFLETTQLGLDEPCRFRQHDDFCWKFEGQREEPWLSLSAT